MVKLSGEWGVGNGDQGIGTREKRKEKKVVVRYFNNIFHFSLFIP
jgi:hypothetical protein